MRAPRRPTVLALVGATATGKTAVAEWIAARFGCDVVCADSRQVFRELSAGTGKPDPESLSRRPHALFDALSVGERASAGWYARAAGETCRAILARGGTALLVGGSGLYLEALMTGLAPEPPHDPALRAQLAEEGSRLGTPALHARLRALDREAADRLRPTDTQRVQRALEVVLAGGRPMAWWRAQAARGALEADWRLAELRVPPAALAARIEARTRAMFDGDIVRETEALVESGREHDLRALRAVGYDEALECVCGRMDRAEAVARTNARTRQLAKRQRTWFRHRVAAARIDASAYDVAALGAAVLAALEREPRGG